MPRPRKFKSNAARQAAYRDRLRGVERPPEHYNGGITFPGQSLTYSALHSWLGRTFPKTHVCEECGEGPTQYAFKHHPEPHTRNRDDYRELCAVCHGRVDAQLRRQMRDETRDETPAVPLAVVSA